MSDQPTSGSYTGLFEVVIKKEELEDLTNLLHRVINTEVVDKEHVRAFLMWNEMKMYHTYVEGSPLDQ